MSGDRLSTLFSKDEVMTILTKCLKTSDFILDSYTVEGEKGDLVGFLGEHVSLKAQFQIGEITKEKVFFVKKTPTEVPDYLKYALTTRAFYKEIEFYETVLVDLKKAQKDAKSTTKWCAELYYSREDELLVLENLVVAGYYMMPERTEMDEDHVRAAIRAIAAMHAASFVFEEKFNQGKVSTLSKHFTRTEGKKPTIGDIYSHLMFETEASDIKGHPGNNWYEAGFRSTVAVIDLLPNYTTEEKEKIKMVLPEKLRKILTYWVKPSDRYRNVIAHGDLWANNMLFKKDKTGKVEEAILVDFQMMHYTCPAQDLTFFLYLVSEPEIREKKRLEWLNYYYSIFSEELAKNDFDAQTLLPLDEFFESCDYYREFGTLLCVPLYQFVYLPPEILNQMMTDNKMYQQIMFVDRDELIKKLFQTDETFRSHVAEAVNAVIKQFILV